jgi:hypothetical protein
MQGQDSMRPAARFPRPGRTGAGAIWAARRRPASAPGTNGAAPASRVARRSGSAWSLGAGPGEGEEEAKLSGRMTTLWDFYLLLLRGDRLARPGRDRPRHGLGTLANWLVRSA